MLQSTRLQREGHEWATEQQQQNERLASIFIVKTSHNLGALNLRAVVSSSLESRCLRSWELQWNFHNHAVWNLSLLPPGNLSPQAASWSSVSSHHGPCHQSQQRGKSRLAGAVSSATTFRRRTQTTGNSQPLYRTWAGLRGFLSASLKHRRTSRSWSSG